MWIHARSQNLDAIGRVIDFSVLKSTIGAWVDEYWDHTFIVNAQDIELIESLKPHHKNKPLWIAPFNPTAENMAKHILEVVSPDILKNSGVEVFHIELYETENCKADAKLSN